MAYELNHIHKILICYLLLNDSLLNASHRSRARIQALFGETFLLL